MTGGVSGADRRGRLQRLTDAALAHLDLDPLLRALLQGTRDVLEVDTAAILLTDDSGQSLVLRAALGIEEHVEGETRVRVGEGFAGRVASEVRPAILDEVEAGDGLTSLLLGQGVTSLLGAPIVAHGTVLGILHVGSIGGRSFDTEDVELLQLAAGRVAIAVQHARAYEAERAARLRLEHLQSVTDAALAHLELDELLAVLLPKVCAILSADTGAVLLVDERAQELVVRAAVGIEEEVERGVRIPLGRGFAGRVAAERTPVCLPDVDHADVLSPILSEKGVKSLLGVPLLAGGRTTGVLHVGTLVHRHFGEPDTELLQLVAERVALAIERAQLHEETVMLDRLKANFVAIASHELRTPATSVYGVLATLSQRGGELTQDLRLELVRMGFEQAERMRHLLNELLDLSRMDARTIALDPRPVVVRSVVARIAAQALPDEPEIDLEIASDLAAVVDPDVLDRVLSNLLINAARYGKTPIVVRAERRDHHLRIAVEDHGEGIPAELRSRLFERFARGERTEGSGLGLAIARAYARAHGGDLVYNPQGGGAQFELVVPQD